MLAALPDMSERACKHADISVGLRKFSLARNDVLQSLYEVLPSYSVKRMPTANLALFLAVCSSDDRVNVQLVPYPVMVQFIVSLGLFRV